MTETTEDGRVARGQRTREAVIDALMGLYAEGNLTPTIEEIAARVGRTTRAIYHHFQDREALAVAIAERHLERHLELFTARPITGTRAERIDGIVHHRAELFEAVAPARRSALVRMHRSPEIQTQQTTLAAHLREQLARTFEPELSALDTDAADEVLELIDLHTSWETWDRLRTWQSLPVERSRRLVTGLVTEALE
ncbi:MAG: TetR/AcrR family transcriptional regulator [Acidimicrobiia bacterium]|nr:TetR/AcrR family transcriptional regulator [Acidimicrobiia bacterium]MDH5236895.1 TetR/AcrR family transcriptional regulator [Acidimicrobiia bacterium]